MNPRVPETPGLMPRFSIFLALIAASSVPAEMLRAQTVADGFDASVLVAPFENTSFLLDETELPSGIWQFDNALTHDGIDSIKAVLPNRSENRLETTVQGPAVVSFWWRIDAVPYFDSLRFDSSSDLATIAPSPTLAPEWQQRSFIVDCGEQNLAWSFVRFASHPVGTGSAWLDELSVTPIPNNPVLQSAADHNAHTLHSTDWGSVAKNGALNGVVAKSGPLQPGGRSVMVLEVEGPAVVTFDWGIESDETTESTFSFYIDNVEFTNITGLQDLHERKFNLKPGTHCLKWAFTRSSSVNEEYQGGYEGYLDDLRVETYAESASLANAVERSDGVYSNTWSRDILEHHDGTDSATVSATDLNDSKILFIELPSEAGLLSFWTKTKSEPDHGFLYAFVDGELVLQQSGIRGWTRKELNLSAKASSRLLEVYFYRDANSDEDGTDHEAWIDQVVFTPGETNYQPDLSIAPKGKKMRGDGIVNRSGGRQSVTKSVPSRRTLARFSIAARNRSSSDQDRVYFRGLGSVKKFDVVFVVKVGKKLLNYTSALRTGKFNTLDLAPGAIERHELWVYRLPENRNRKHRYSIRGTSKTDPRKTDLVRTMVKVGR